MPSETCHRYVIALGSNVRHARHGAPRDVLRAALAELQHEGLAVIDTAPAIATAPLGPSRRRYANSAALVETTLEPNALLALLKRIERRFGRRAGGKRWRARVLDLDVILWSGGMWGAPGLVVPHVSFRERGFVLHPATALAPDWRDPVGGLTLRQLRARLTRPRALP
ncbi:MAG TPA: 2-amino-4-hydroxy-6-hydroxymethyldihydropteridine diphosphokinase [Croceibacterium sp.]|nr:2-amino-4-hydroxy-6-hydroxymethyldihydropteridine diphosphokinase [Croceibacterium sp.]